MHYSTQSAQQLFLSLFDIAVVSVDVVDSQRAVGALLVQQVKLVFVGCWGTGAGFFGDYARRMHLVMYDAEYRRIKNVMDKHCRQEGYKVIPVNEGGIESILRIKEVLDRREYVCFQGDRFVEGGATAPVTFMGRKALFPAGPFVVAEKFRAPAVFYYAMRERGRRYRFIFDIPEAPDGKTPNAVLESYVRSLEAVVRRYPQQWFNFYRFWS